MCLYLASLQSDYVTNLFRFTFPLFLQQNVWEIMISYISACPAPGKHTAGILYCPISACSAYHSLQAFESEKAWSRGKTDTRNYLIFQLLGVIKVSFHKPTTALYT